MILFPADSLEKRSVERDYAHEYDAARNAGFDTAIFNFDALTRGENPNLVFRGINFGESIHQCIYRGWMLTPELYVRFYEGLIERGCALINDIEQYRFCHSLPANYSVLEGMTPETIWLPREEFETAQGTGFAPIFKALERFGDRAIIVKDYVKSQKHKWLEACFIPAANDKAAVERVTRRFLELQGEFLYSGLVFREFVPLRSVGTHPQSGMPLTAEWRLFFLDGQLLLSAPYWKEGEYDDIEPDLKQFLSLATRIPSRFFTMDIAQTESGNWIVIELGDGQVSGLPRVALAGEIYRDFRRKLGR